MAAPRPRSAHAASPPLALRLDPDSPLSLQHQIRGQLLDAVARGVFAPNKRLPSSRELARQMGVARNTVVLACQKLIAEGHLVARERRGLFVNEETVKSFALRAPATPTSVAPELDIKARLKAAVPTVDLYRCPPDWQKYPFPFVEGRFDRSLYPIAEWREAVRLALSARQADAWSKAAGDFDDPLLVREICEKILPRRGIKARPEEVLLTAGTKEGLHLLTELMVVPGTRVCTEDPGNPEFLQLLRRKGAHWVPAGVDADGIRLGSATDTFELIYVTPSHQRPTAATLSMDRRLHLLKTAAEKDFLVIEDDFECETNYLDDAFPALRGLEGGERVVYVASLSRALSPVLRLGFVVASPEIVQEARRLSHLTTRPPPLSTQRAAALFFSLGHYDRTMIKLGRAFRTRLVALRDALNHYLPQSIAVAPVRGGTTLWVRGPDGLDARDLARAAEAHGILIEPVRHYYARDKAPANVFRMSVTGISADRIRQGVAELSGVIRELSAGSLVMLDLRGAQWLKARELRRIIPGSTFLYQTVYGDPCTIELERGGRMRGRAGYANEDQDTGRWWIEGDLWCRQWQSWAYGEVSKYRTRLEGDRIQWFNESGRLVDSAVLVRHFDRRNRSSSTAA